MFLAGIPDRVNRGAKRRVGVVTGSVDSDVPVADDAPPTDLISRSDISPVGLPAVTPRSLEQLHTRARRWLGSEYDLDALDLTLTAAAVERLDGDRGTRLLGLLYKT